MPNPPKHAQFKKGKSGNPGGRPSDPPEFKKLKNLTKSELVDIGNLIIKMNLIELKALSNDSNATVIQRMISSVAVKIISKGDMHALDILLNRLVGKVKDELDLGGQIKMAKVVVNIPSNGREVKVTDESSE